MADVGEMIRAWRCRRLTAALVDYADGGLPPGRRARVERHLDRCVRCRETVAALAEVPTLVRDAVPLRDDAFWIDQRRRILRAVGEPAAAPVRAPLPRFDWRLALPVAAAAAIAIAGYLSLRPPPAPGAMALDALPSEDLAALVEVAGGLVAPADLPVDVRGDNSAVAGAIDAGWVNAADLSAPFGWGDLEPDDLDTLHGMLG